MEERIWRLIADMQVDGFFVTAEIHRKGSGMPVGLEAFVRHKLQLILEGIRSRRFVFSEDGWRIYITFFPTTEVVDGRYALMNKVVSRGYK